MDYKVVLDDLEGKLRAGQARFQAWEKERDELLKAIEAVKPLIAREKGGQIPLAGFGEIANAPPAFEGHMFRGLSYRDATRKVFKLSAPRSLSAPDVTDILFAAGYASSRRLIKSNVDGIFKQLRDDTEIERAGDGAIYKLAATNGKHP